LDQATSQMIGIILIGVGILDPVIGLFLVGPKIPDPRKRSAVILALVGSGTLMIGLGMAFLAGMVA